MYSSVCPTALTFRIWDLLFYDGSVVLFRIALALLSYKSEEILSLNNSSQIFHSLSNAPGSVTDINELVKAAYSLNDEHLEPSNISSLRRHYLAQLMVDEGAVLKPDSRPNLPKQVSKSLIYFICFLCSVHFSFCLIKANSSLLFQSHLLSILTLLFSGLPFEGRAIQYYAEYVYQ
ncbi:unnamed protein product [Schistosoma margrebowiei]|uniref:Rab-GAP TBC domain-containing protein n=1 Tax=Schistosoma margrebowiei TaxID=48269 RepID=A0A3P8I5B4_9TREM|nr:unnamed protein product [Schistosoma margrebowiei]